MLAQKRPIASVERSIRTLRKLDFSVSLEKEQTLLQSTIEYFLDGVVIVTKQGKRVLSNALADQICTQFIQEKSQPQELPKSIWRVCQMLLNCCNTSVAGQSVVLESELVTELAMTVRVRVFWLQSEVRHDSYLLVILENRTQTIQNLAIAEAYQYGLTPREADVWLLRRASCSYAVIFNRLYITINTVRKHLKSTCAKRKACLFVD